MTTMSHQYLATWFFSDEEIEKVIVKINSDFDKDELIKYFMENYSLENIEIRGKYDW